jgi:four helix bundle protein
VAWSGDLLDGAMQGTRLSAARDLDQASTSIPLNIAEGNGKRSDRDRCGFFDIAKGSALECAACLDVFVARKACTAEKINEGKALLVRIVEILFKLVSMLLASEPESQRTQR